ncbi:hypothetical protein OE88DRAFT_1670268 [Heliocybe sulcata]|uniref:F-box domain-containing protein n=1 Tax=Heliocybe sulcata TaxID=5364 RepID=A0A5C3NHB7_9AGAM|nr:hypothetical protein OE88DRAFT_1670268 [Heliocybe sulcata]
MSVSHVSHAVLLTPRPFEDLDRAGRFMLVPLLPERPPPKTLPVEVWEQIIEDLLNDGNVCKLTGWKGTRTCRRDILLVCKTINNIALPIFYSRVHLNSLEALEKFTNHLHSSDERWDSLRRIPYSTPGRWVQRLDISSLKPASPREECDIDALLTQLFPLLPCLKELHFSPHVQTTGRVLDSLADSDARAHLMVLRGMKGAISPGSALAACRDPLVRVLRASRNMRELEVVGPGFDFSDPDLWEAGEPLPDTTFVPLDLPHLKTLTVLSTQSSPLLYALLHSPLPSLTSLTVTPYHDISYPTSLVSEFIQTHGQNLTSLSLYTPKSWPTILHTSPSTLLETSPNLRHLSLENPIPFLAFPSAVSGRAHPLKIISVPRPSAQFLSPLESILPSLPSLVAVRARDVHWLRKGISSRAQEAGVQGLMRDWKRRFSRRGIKILDADWKECLD